MSQSNDANRTTVSPSAIAQFYKLQQCSMYLHHRYVEEEFAGISDISLSPLLSATGEAFEAGQLRKLLEADVYSVGTEESEVDFDETWTGNADTDMERLRTVIEELATGHRNRPVVFFQPRLEGQVGAWPIRGDADIVIATGDRTTTRERDVHLRVTELKSSSAVKTYHQLQAAVYTLLFDNILSEVEVDISASVVSQDPEYVGLTSVVTATGELDLRRLPTFELSTRQNDVKLLLEPNGTFDDVLLDAGQMREEGEPPLYRIDTRCDGCAKQAKCLAHSVTNKRLSLLGLTEGVQESLRELGVSTLNDLATLYEWPRKQQDRQPTSHTKPRPRDPELVTRILQETDLSNLLDLAQIAHRFLREIDPSYDDEWQSTADVSGPWGDYLIGSGRNLPDDNPPFDPAYPRKSLVRVYPYVQYDFVRNRVAMLAAKVTSSRHEDAGGDGVFVIAEPEQLLTPTEEAKDAEERRLIEDFFEKLTNAVNEVRPNLSDEGYASSEGFLHLYPYGNAQSQSLLDAVKRHPESEAAQTLRTLLGYREDIDQEVVSVLRDEFRSRHAFRYPGLGLVQTAAQFFSNESKLDWEAPRAPDKTPLKRVFALDFFETTVPYTEVSDRILLDFGSGLQIPSDTLNRSYPVVGRHREVLPLEYLYATAEFDIIQPDWAEDEAMRTRIERYRYHTDESTSRISLADITDMVHSVCNAYEHIERCIRAKDATLEKEPLNLADLRQNSLGLSELQSTCLEYQELEYGATRRQLEAQYRKPLSQRATAGQALPFTVTDAPDETEEDSTLLGGSLLRSLSNGVADGVRPDTPLSLEAGSFVVMTPLKRDEAGTGWVEDVSEPRKIANQVLGRLDAVDTQSGSVRVSLNWPTNQPQKTFKPNHVGWTSEPDDPWNRQYIEDGMKFVLDPALDDFVGHRAHAAIENAAENDVHNRLVNVYDDEIESALQVDEPLFSRTDVRVFLDAFNRVMPEETNRDQRSFISQSHHTVAALQGPPGTGKTTYAAAPAMLARAYSASTSGFTAVGAAHSNNAVDEIAKSVGQAQRALATDGILEDAKLIRVRSGPASGNLPSNVREYHYYDDRDDLQSLFEAHVFSSRSPEPLIIFTTPVTLRNTVNSVRWAIDEDADSVEEFMTDGRSRLFDLALVDEASMMDLPLLFLIGAFLGQDKQLLLIGDHRQMQPIQSHDWDAENRQTIEENTPAVSALDFIRFLRGDEDSSFERLDRDTPNWPNKDAVLPMDRLRTTYRLPPAMARFETELFYHRDGITLEAGADRELIPDVRGASHPEWLNVALDPESRVTLVVHDDQVYTKDSPVEAHIAKQLLSPLPVVSEDATGGELTAGVVVPFRLMRRRMQNELALTVDTVERFQGGERDVMVLSMTAGNQGYVNKLSEFLLDANRFNVGASRMKQKLFIIVSKSLFRAVTGEPRQYEQQKAWKQLYDSMIAGYSPAASTTLTSNEVAVLGDRTVAVDVYTGYRD